MITPDQKGWIGRLKRDRKKKRFGAWQIEITTRCSLRCTMCIKTACSDWRREDMDREDFRKIAPYLADVETVVLEGWGESLLHKDLVEFIRLVKVAGARAGFVTSGMGLTDDYARQIVEAGTDFIGFSLSGGTAETHNTIRINSDFDSLVASIKTLQRLRLQNPSGKPKLHIVYLMLKNNVHEIPVLLNLAHEIGIGEITLLNIVQVTTGKQDDQKTFTYENGSLYPDTIKEAEARAKTLKITLSLPAIVPQNMAVCSENLLDNLYLSVEGEVSPCVFLHPPVSSPFTRIFCGGEYPTHSVSFGNILKEAFDDIWSRKDYQDFRNSFEARRKRWEEAYDSLLALRLPASVPIPEPPPPCRTCHKMLGF